jgi:hypothetical protein
MDLERITRTAIAATLITAWAGAMMFWHINPAFFGILLLAASFVRRDDPFFEPQTLDRTSLMAFIGMLLLAGSIGLLTFAIGEETMLWFMHSPYFVLPIWLFMMWAFMRRGPEPASASTHDLSHPAITRTPAKPAASSYRSD